MVPEGGGKRHGKVLLALVVCRLAGCVSWLCAMAASTAEVGRRSGAGREGRHCAHSRGRTLVQRTDLGPCSSQKCANESYIRSARKLCIQTDAVERTMISIEIGPSKSLQRDIVAGKLAPYGVRYLIESTLHTGRLCRPWVQASALASQRAKGR